MTHIIGTIINDCREPFDQARQELRFETLFGVKPTFLGVEAYNTLEAAGSLADQLDILINFPLVDKNQQKIVLVNVAPRAEEVKKKWDNGTPFCYFRLGNILVVSTYEGYCLALLRDLGIINEVKLLDVPAVTAAAVARGELTQAEANKIRNSQFRSLEFVPLVAYWLWKRRKVPSTARPLDELPSTSNLAWIVDNFADVKTTLVPEEIGYEAGKQFTLADGQPAICYPRLADVPIGVTGLTIGSSGFGNKRFIEVAVGGCGRAGDRHGFTIGSRVLKAEGEA